MHMAREEIVGRHKMIIDEYCSRNAPSLALFAQFSSLAMPAAGAPPILTHTGKAKTHTT
jgi:hypothetical protein